MFIDPLGFSAVGDMYQGVITAVTEGAKGRLDSAGQAANDIGELALHGDPFAKTALGVAGASLAAPLACVAGEVYPAAMAAAGTPQGQQFLESSYDFISAALPATSPAPNWAGLYGYLAGELYGSIGP
jgi:hypothetical protein